jgi:hypothetical protein
MRIDIAYGNILKPELSMLARKPPQSWINSLFISKYTLIKFNSIYIEQYTSLLKLQQVNIEYWFDKKPVIRVRIIERD